MFDFLKRVVPEGKPRRMRTKSNISRFKIPLGEKVTDNVTGFSGTITGRAEYITGCRQYCIVGQSENGKAAAAEWFDESRLTGVVESLDTGGPQVCPAPLK